MSEQCETILVLSQADTRFFQSISSAALWSFDFKLFKVGSKEVVGSSSNSTSFSRSVTLRVELTPGDYVVQVSRNKDTDRMTRTDTLSEGAVRQRN
jgi:hypothetical protein